jgi:hypothetical protein
MAGCVVMSHQLKLTVFSDVTPSSMVEFYDVSDEHATTIFIIILSGVRLSPLGTAATTGLLYQPRMLDEGDCGAIGRMQIDRGNRSTRRKPAPVPLCLPQIPHDLTRARTGPPRWDATTIAIVEVGDIMILRN